MNNSSQTLNTNISIDRECTNRIEIGITDITYYGIACFLFIVSIVGILMNGIVIYVFHRFKNVQTSSNYFIIALCVCGLLICVLGVPFSAVSAIYREWQFGYFLCRFHGFLMTGLGITMIAIFTAISIDKYIAIVKYSAGFKVSKKGTILMIFLCVAYGITWALCPILGWSSYTFEIAKISCSIHWEDRSSSSLSYHVCLMVAGLYLPLTVIISLYSQILKMLHARSALVISSSLYRGTVKRERKVTKIIILMIASFVVTWMPYTIFSTIALVGHGGIISPLAQTLPSMFAKSSVLWNPIIYALKNSTMKDAILNVCSLKNRPRQNHRKHKIDAKKDSESYVTATSSKAKNSSSHTTEMQTQQVDTAL